MNENNSGTMGHGDGELRVDQSGPAASEAHTTSFANVLGRNEVDSDARTSRTRSQLCRCIKVELMEKCKRSEQLYSGLDAPKEQKAAGMVWTLGREDKDTCGTSGKTCK